MSSSSVIRELQALGSPEKAAVLSRFFKTGPGQYGEGDVFFGVTVPEARAVAKRYRELSLSEVEKLLSHRVHECRLAGLLILVDQFSRADAKRQREIVMFYLTHLDGVNNWDLVDLSADKILGMYLLRNPSERKLLEKLITSKVLWERRVAMVSMFAFIKNRELELPMDVAERLLFDRHDLMQKAVGWMLREVGKRDEKLLVSFVKKYQKTMPRTTLRYAIERFPLEQRKRFMER